MRFIRRSLFVATLLALLVSTLPGLAEERGPADGASSPAVARPAWLRYVNQLRKLAGLPGVTQSLAWNEGGRLHSRYMVKNDEITHYEDSSKPWYTEKGALAGANGNVMVSGSTTATNQHAIDSWMTGPFHGIGIIDPQLRKVGFGSYREAGSGWQMGATLDVLRGLGPLPASVKFPVRFPKAGGTTHLSSYNGFESPDPLTSCPDYTAPSGLPIMLQIGDGSLTPDVTAHSLRSGGKAVPHCIFDETNYKNPDSNQESLGRSVLGGRDAIVLIPREPLTPGARYTVSITANGTRHTWSFTVSKRARGIEAGLAALTGG